MPAAVLLAVKAAPGATLAPATAAPTTTPAAHSPLFHDEPTDARRAAFIAAVSGPAPVETAPSAGSPATSSFAAPDTADTASAAAPTEEPEPYHPVIEPLFSNEGIVRWSFEHRRSWHARLRAQVVGAAAALGGARSAFAHRADSNAAAAESAAGSVTDQVPVSAVAGIQVDSGSRTDSPGHFSDTRAFAWIATAVLGVRTVLTWLGAAVAVVVLPIALGIGRVVSPPTRAVVTWMQGGKRADAELSGYDGERRRRRVSPFWLLFTAFYLVVAAVIAVNVFFSTSTPSPSSRPNLANVSTPTPTLPGAVVSGGTASPGAHQPGNPGPAVVVVAPAPITGPTPGPASTPAPTTAGPTPKPMSGSTPGPTPKPTPTPPPGPTPTPPPGATPPPTPTPPPGATAIPTPTRTPTPTPTRTPTPTPTRTPTPTPTRTPTPTPTPPPTPTPTPVLDTDQVATGPNALLHGTDYSFWIIWINGATCHLTRAEGPVNSKTKTIDDPNNTPSWLGLLWGGAWPAGSYTVTATCTASGVGTVTSAPLPITYR